MTATLPRSVTDARHGEAIPVGAALARLLRTSFGRQCSHVLQAVTGPRLPAKCPPLGKFARPLAEAAQPLLVGPCESGARRSVKRITAAAAARGAKGAPRRTVAELLRIAWDLFNGHVLGACSKLSLDLALSTLATTTLRVDEALAATREAIADGLDRGEAVKRLTERVQGIFHSPQRALAIAMTESSRAMHAGQVMLARGTGGLVKGKKWLASSDACPTCEELNGKEVGLDEPFDVDPKGGPYAITYHPTLHTHCMCTMTEVLDL